MKIILVMAFSLNSWSKLQHVAVQLTVHSFSFHSQTIVPDLSKNIHPLCLWSEEGNSAQKLKLGQKPNFNILYINCVVQD